MFKSSINQAFRLRNKNTDNSRILIYIFLLLWLSTALKAQDAPVKRMDHIAVEEFAEAEHTKPYFIEENQKTTDHQPEPIQGFDHENAHSSFQPLTPMPLMYNRSTNHVGVSSQRPAARTISESSRQVQQAFQRRNTTSSTDTDLDGIPDVDDLCPDYMDTALDFDGVNDYVYVFHDPALNLGATDFTVEAWINSPLTGANQTILSKGSGNAGNTNFILTLASGNNIGFYFREEWHYGTTILPVGQWTHVAVSYNLANDVAILYINGVTDGAFNYTMPPFLSDNRELFMGVNGYDCVCTHFQGRIDDVAIWNTQRSSSDIICGMATKLTGDEAGLVAAYDMNEAPACMNNVNSNSVTAYDQTANQFNGFLSSFDLIAGCTSNWASGRNLDSDQDGLGDGCDYLCFIDDGDADAVPNSIDLCPSTRDAALNFDGADDYVTIPHDANLNLGATDFTIETWINTPQTGQQSILCKGTGQASGTNHQLILNPNNELGFYFADEWHYGTIQIPAYSWTHVAITYNSRTKEVVFYVNGKEDETFNYPNAPLLSNTDSLYVGIGGSTCQCDPFEGRLDDLSIWNRIRSHAQITCDMSRHATSDEMGLVVSYDLNEAAACVDNTSRSVITDGVLNSYNGVLNNFDLGAGCTSNWSSGRNEDSDQDGTGDGCDQTCADYDFDDDGIPDSTDICPGYMDVALDFDGINDHVNIPHDPAQAIGANNFTIQAWINPRDTGLQTIVAKGFGFNAASVDYVLSINSTGELELWYAGTATTSNSSIPLNTWTHVAVAFDISTKQAHYYVNGINDGVTNHMGVPSTSDSGSLLIGRQGSGCSTCAYFNGAIDDVAIWSTFRSSSDLVGDMATRIDGLGQFLVCAFDMNEAPACTYSMNELTLFDLSPNGMNGVLNWFDLKFGCESNYVPGRNLDSDMNGIGDGCQYRCDGQLNVLYVDSAASTGLDVGSTWTHAHLSLSDALEHFEQCPGVDSILVAKGTYLPLEAGLSDPRSASFVIPEGVHIMGEYPTGGGTWSQRDTMHTTIMSGNIGNHGSNADNTYHVVQSANISTITTVAGFTITGGRADGGGVDNDGAGWLIDTSALVIQNCQFINNHADGLGGGLRFIGDSLSLDGCAFVNNSALSLGGGLYVNGMRINGSQLTFAENHSLFAGGGFYSQSATVFLTECTFEQNTATSYGGGISIFSGPLTCQNSTFSENSSQLSGGGIHSQLDSMAVVNCHFNANVSQYGGGLSHLDAPLHAPNLFFTNDSAQFGGGLYHQNAQALVTHSQFNLNTSSEDGGGLYLFNSSTAVSNCTFLANFAQLTGGGMFDNSPAVSDIDSCTFVDNKAGSGGGLRIRYTQSNVTNCHFESNDARAQGGGLFADSTMLTMNNCDFKSNTSLGFGGGLCLKLVRLSATNASVDSNMSTSHGGGLYAEGSGVFLPTVNLHDCSFSHNSSSDAGGGVYTQTVPVTVVNSTMNNNSGTDGGGLYSFLAPVSLIESQYINNTATNFGGGAAIFNAPLTAHNSLFEGNTTSNIGGGLHAQNDSVSLGGCIFNSNTSGNAGGGASFLNSAFKADSVLYNDNSALQGGGVFFQYGQGTFTDCQFSGNHSDQRGGGVFSFGSLMFHDVSFTHNTANFLGGGLYCQLAPVTLTNCRLSNNSVANSTDLCFGGGISTLQVPSFTASSCLFKGNTATGGGGGLSIESTPVSNLQNCIFRFNQVHNDSTIGTGGGIQLQRASRTEVVNCLFEANQGLGTADDGGGAIMIYGGEVYLTNSTLVNNYSATHGGAISVFGRAGLATVTNSVLWNNAAPADSLVYNGNGGSAQINHSLLDADSCLSNVICGPGMIYNENPLFADSISTMPSGGDFRLRYPSPALNAGINDSVSLNGIVALNDVFRIINSTVDMGAYEFNYEFPCGEYNELMVDDVPVFMGDYKASGLISSTGLINGNSNGLVRFKSESAIELNSGFEVEVGEEFEALIEDPCVE